MKKPSRSKNIRKKLDKLSEINFKIVSKQGVRSKAALRARALTHELTAKKAQEDILRINKLLKTVKTDSRLRRLKSQIEINQGIINNNLRQAKSIRKHLTKE